MQTHENKVGTENFREIFFFHFGLEFLFLMSIDNYWDREKILAKTKMETSPLTKCWIEETYAWKL